MTAPPIAPSADDFRAALPERPSTRLRHWWRRYWWIVLTATAVLAFALALWGAEGGFLRRLNTALLILPVGVKAPEADTSTPLQVARILAPLVFAYATFKGVLILFGERLQDLRAARAKGHTVVCGLGRRGQTLVESLLGSAKVVVLEINPANLAIPRLRDAGAIVLVGDASDPVVLQRAKAARAANVVSVCGEDAVNAQIAANVLEEREGETSITGATFVHVGDPRLYTFLLHHSFSSPKTRLEFFNVYERGARRLLYETEPARADVRPILVLGAGQFGLALVSQLAREHFERLGSRPGLGKLPLHLVDREAVARTALLTERYSRLREACDLEAIELDVASPAFDHLLERSPALAEMGIAYVCFDNDGLTISSSLNLLDQARGRFAVVARVTHRSEGIAGLIQEAQSRYADATAFQPVSIAERACRADLVLEGMRGQLAREVHDAYRSGRPGTPYDVAWNELSAEGRERNLQHADAIAQQLEAIGYRLGPLIDWGAPLPVLSEDELERMSELEHERWMAERVAEGWRRGPVRNDDERIHPDLAPWAELPEPQRDINRRLLRDRPAMLARVGIQLYRAEPERS